MYVYIYLYMKAWCCLSPELATVCPCVCVQEKAALEERVRELEKKWEGERGELEQQLLRERERVQDSDSAAKSRETELLLV